MPNSFDELRKKNQQRAYAHFGRRGSMKDAWIWEYIIDPAKVKNIIFIHLFHMKRIIQNMMGKSRILKIEKKRNTENSAIPRI